jgi:hypothetical protein
MVHTRLNFKQEFTMSSERGLKVYHPCQWPSQSRSSGKLETEIPRDEHDKHRGGV